jgi:hypothetical protein
VSSLSLPQQKLANLYEQVTARAMSLSTAALRSMLQIILEMLELRENETARALLRNTPAMQELKAHDWERYRKIEDLLVRTYFDARDVRHSICMALGLPS